MPPSTPQAGSCSPCKFAILSSFKIPSQLALLLGSSSALTHPWREKKQGKGKETKRSYVLCDHWESWGFLPLLDSCLPLLEDALGRDSVSIPAGRLTVTEIQILNGILSLEGLPRFSHCQIHCSLNSWWRSSFQASTKTRRRAIQL